MLNFIQKFGPLSHLEVVNVRLLIEWLAIDRLKTNLNESIINHSGQSQGTQKAQLANQNSKHVHVTGVKRGKTRARKVRLVCILLDRKEARVLPTNDRAS